MSMAVELGFGIGLGIVQGLRASGADTESFISDAVSGLFAGLKTQEPNSAAEEPEAEPESEAPVTPEAEPEPEEETEEVEKPAPVKRTRTRRPAVKPKPEPEPEDDPDDDDRDDDESDDAKAATSVRPSRIAPKKRAAAGRR